MLFRRHRAEHGSDPLLDAIRERWPALSEDEVRQTGADPSALAGLLELSLGYGAAHAREEVDLFFRSLSAAAGAR